MISNKVHQNPFTPELTESVIFTTDYNRFDHLYVETDSDAFMTIECLEILPIIKFLIANGFSLSQWEGAAMRFVRDNERVFVYRTRKGTYRFVIPTSEVRVYPHQIISGH